MAESLLRRRLAVQRLVRHRLVSVEMVELSAVSQAHKLAAVQRAAQLELVSFGVFFVGGSLLESFVFNAILFIQILKLRFISQLV